MKIRTATFFMLSLLLMLVVYGLIMLYSTSFATHGEKILLKQVIWVGVGSLLAAALWRLDYRLLGQYAWVAMVGIGILLAYLASAYVMYKFELLPREVFAKLPLVPDHPTKGSFRWLRLGQFSLQPSEFAKPILFFYLAQYYGNLDPEKIRDRLTGVFKPLAWAGSILVLVLAGKDLSTTVITGSIVFTIMLVAGVRLRWLVGIAALGLVAFALILSKSPERMSRFTVFRDPEAAQSDEGYQLWHSQLALGSGGLTGLQFTGSRMKQMYLPEAHTDFIVAIIGEELGYVGVMALVCLYCGLAAMTIWCGVLAIDRVGLLIALGTGLSLALQAFVNMSVVSGFCPTTGVTAPFMSYGGSSMIASFIGIGLLLSSSRITVNEILDREARARYRTTPLSNDNDRPGERQTSLAVAFDKDKTSA